MNKKMTVGSLFSGAGLGDLGLEWAGFEHKWFCECDDYARKVLELRWPGVPIYGDIKEVDFKAAPKVDLLAGGFPCQDISVAGKGAGIKGEQSGLWSEFARAIGDIRPRYALIENSPALVNRGLDVVLSDLASLGYDAEWHCVPAAALGAPHIRDRIWIVATPSSDERHVRHELEGDGRQEEAQQARMGSCGKKVGNSKRDGRDTRRKNNRKYDRDIASSANEFSGEMADSVRPRCQEFDIASLAAGEGQCSGMSLAQRGEAWWATEPELGRVAYGVPHRVDRLRCIGNGQVPHCTYFIGRLIREHANA